MGSTGADVVVIQTALNRIAQSYPAIPKIPEADGIFGSRTEAAVRATQQIFGLTPDGIVGPATWYEIVRLYTAVTDLAELRSEGQQFYSVNWQSANALQVGNSGEKVRQLQYMLSVLSKYIPEVPPLQVDGIYGQQTAAAVSAAQRWLGLPQTGQVDRRTWDEIYDQYSGIENTTLRSSENFPNVTQPSVTAFAAANGRRNMQSRPNGNRNSYWQTTTMTQFPGKDLSMGMQDPVRQEVVR